MCDPVSAVMIGVAVASSVGGNIAARKGAKAQAKAINKQAAVNAEEARLEASAQMFDDMRAARREAGRTRAAAGEAGLSLESGSVEALLMDSAMQSELKNDRSLANLESRRIAIEAEQQAKMSQISMPSTLGMVIEANQAFGKAYAGSPAGRNA